MAFTQAQLDTLDAAIAQGTLSVQFDGRTVTYRSLNEMMRLRDFISSKLGIKPASGSSSIVYPQTGKGL